MSSEKIDNGVVVWDQIEEGGKLDESEVVWEASPYKDTTDEYREPKGPVRSRRTSLLLSLLIATILVNLAFSILTYQMLSQPSSQVRFADGTLTGDRILVYARSRYQDVKVDHSLAEKTIEVLYVPKPNEHRRDIQDFLEIRIYPLSDVNITIEPWTGESTNQGVHIIFREGDGAGGLLPDGKFLSLSANKPQVLDAQLTVDSRLLKESTEAVLKIEKWTIRIQIRLTSTG